MRGPASAEGYASDRTLGEKCVDWAVEEAYYVDRHALAALCLYGQPFGFTQEDVRSLEMLAKRAEDGAKLTAQHAKDARTHKNAEAYVFASAMHSVEAKWFRSLASRIAALLPPEPKQ